MEIQAKQLLGNVATGSARKAPAAGAQSPAVSGDVPKTGGEPALQLAGLKERLMAAPAADSSRVETVSSRIQSGSYRIDPEKVASKMIEAELALP